MSSKILVNNLCRPQVFRVKSGKYCGKSCLPWVWNVDAGLCNFKKIVTEIFVICDDLGNVKVSGSATEMIWESWYCRTYYCHMWLLRNTFTAMFFSNFMPSEIVLWSILFRKIYLIYILYIYIYIYILYIEF